MDAKKDDLRRRWQATLESAESGLGGLTINVGTSGGQIHDSDISINEINTAKRNIERLQSEPETELNQDDYYATITGLMEMQELMFQRIGRLEITVVNNSVRITPDIRERIAIIVSNTTVFLVAFLILFDDTYSFGQENPIESLLLISSFLFFAIILRILAYPRKVKPDGK